MSLSSFAASVKEFAGEVVSASLRRKSLNQRAATVVAIGYLARMSKTDINKDTRKLGGFTDEQWSVAKPPLSYAWRAIAGEYGYGEKLAEMWAAGNFSVALMDAYAKSAPPKKQQDRIAQAVKLLSLLTEDELNEVLEKVESEKAKYEAIAGTQGERFEALIAVSDEKIVKVA